ncbi:hypothetical protein ACQ4LE_006845 [Meloidogyne hapla]
MTAEFCKSGGIEIEKPIGCKFGSKSLLAREQIINSQDILECLPNGKMIKIGCYLEFLNITMALGQIEALPENNNILIQCQINSTGISFINGVKNCIKEETGEEFLFGSKDEDSDSIRICSRRTDSTLHGVWELTHCLFGTIKIPRGSCFFNKTKDEEKENNKNNSTCNLNKNEGVYKLCEQDENYKAIFLDASFEYCSPSQKIKATDQNGQLLNTQIEDFKKESFECNSDWRPKPLPIELENASEEEDEMDDEYIDDEYSEEDEELKTAEEIEENEQEEKEKILKKYKIQNKLLLQEENGGMRTKDTTLKQIVVEEEEQNMLLDSPPLIEEKNNETEKKQQTIPLQENVLLQLEENKLENLTPTTTIEITTNKENLIQTTTEENKLEYLEITEFKDNKLENVAPTTTEQNKLENNILTTEYLIASTTTQTELINFNETIQELTEEIIEELITTKPSNSIDNETKEKNLNQNFEQTNQNFNTTQSEFEETFEIEEIHETKPIQTINTSSVLLEAFVEATISEQVELTTTELPLLLPAPENEQTTFINKSENKSLFEAEKYVERNAQQKEEEHVTEIQLTENEEEEEPHSKIVASFFNNVKSTPEVNPIPAPPTFDFNKAVDLLLEINLEKTKKLKSGDCDENEGETNNKVFDCKNRLSEHFCSAFKSMCLFPTGDSAIHSVALIHTLHYLRHFIGGGNMRANLRFAANFLETGLAQTFVDRQEINRMIYKIGGLLNLFPSEDDLAELLLSAEGGPIIERMLQLKKESAYQCGLSRLDCNSPSTDVPSSFTINLPKALKCKRKWQSCLRVASSKLSKEFELLLWHFRAQLLPYPHGAFWLLCSKTCGHCLPVAIADGSIDNWKEENPNLIETKK